MDECKEVENPFGVHIQVRWCETHKQTVTGCWKDQRDEARRLLEKANSEIARLNDSIHLSWICAECGGFAHSTDDCLDTGTTLVCEVCKGKTIVELHTGESYKKSNDMILQNEALKTLLESVAADIEFGDLKDPHGDAKAILPDIYKLTRAVAVNRDDAPEPCNLDLGNSEKCFLDVGHAPPCSRYREKRVDAKCGHRLLGGLIDNRYRRCLHCNELVRE